jgi:hypothetical protein
LFATASEATTVPLSGRRAQAARNDRRILEAARTVLVAEPGAPISAVAAHAGVGISAPVPPLPQQEELLQRLSGDGLRRIVDADTHSLTLRLAGTFTPTEALYHDAARAQELNLRLFERTRAAGAIRPDVDVNDLSFALEQVASIRLGDQQRTSQLRHRYLTLLLDDLHTHRRDHCPGRHPAARSWAAAGTARRIPDQPQQPAWQPSGLESGQGRHGWWPGWRGCGDEIDVQPA